MRQGRGFDRSGRRASVSILAAVFTTVLVGAAALTADLSNLYLTRLQSQRSADVAVLAAAAVPNAVVAGAPSAEATATAANLAQINGFSNAATTAAISPVPSHPTQYALTTTITNNTPYLFGGWFGNGSAQNVSSASSAEIGTNGGGCLVTLSSSLDIINNAVVNGPNCTLASNTYFQCDHAPTAVTVAQVIVGDSASDQSSNCPAGIATVKGGYTYNTPPTDTLASIGTIGDIKRMLSKVTSSMAGNMPAMPSPLSSPPAATGANNSTLSNASGATVLQSSNYIQNLAITASTVTFKGNNGVADPYCQTPTSIHGNLTLSGTNTITFNTGCYYISGTVTTGNGGSQTTFVAAAGATVTFYPTAINDTGSMTFQTSGATVTYLIGNGGVTIQSASTLTLGSGTVWDNNSTINNAGNGTVTFGNGPFYFYGGAGITNNSTGSMTFGNGPFWFATGNVQNASTGSITLGTGAFYHLGNGHLINSHGTFISGKGASFFMGGNYEVDSGSSTTFGDGDVYFANGGVSSNTSTTKMAFGKGTVYLSGGSPTAGSGSLQLSAATVIATSNTFVESGGDIQITGVGNIDLEAPLASNYGCDINASTCSSACDPTLGCITQYPYQLLYNGSHQILVNDGGGSGTPSRTLGGIIYTPTGYIQFHDPENVAYSSTAANCLEIVGSHMDIDGAGGTTNMAVAPCPGLGESVTTSGGSGTLVQ